MRVFAKWVIRMLACVAAMPVVASAATIVVTTAADDATPSNGQCTFREALHNVNAAADTTGGDCAAGSGGGDTVTFAIAGSGVHTIALGSALPEVVRRIHIDGYSQPGAARSSAGAPIDAVLTIELRDGGVVGGDGLVIAADGSVVEGLVINGFLDLSNPFLGGAAIRLPDARAFDIRIQGNFVGTDAAGGATLGNVFGVFVGDGAHDNVIGTDGDGVADTAERNLISGNGQGVTLGDGVGNRIAGNFIGVGANGTTVVDNGRGILLGGSIDSFVGTNGDGVADAAERNVLSGNLNEQIYLTGAATGNRIAGNYFCTDLYGSTRLAPILEGIGLNFSHRNVIGTNGDGIADEAERNVIACAGHAIYLQLQSSENVIAGNYIGLDASGTSALGRGGIALFTSSNNRIGTNADGASDALEANVIAAARLDAINLGFGSNENAVMGNRLGTDPTGTVPMPNDVGIRLRGGSVGNVIGGDDVRANVISNSVGAAILVVPEAPVQTAGNSILGNVLVGNGGLGIDLGGDGPTANDSGDADDGANRRQNFPRVVLDGDHALVTIDSAPSAPFRVELFANAACPLNGLAQAEIFIGAAEVASDDAGQVAVLIPIGPHGNVTATATNLETGDTSELSRCAAEPSPYQCYDARERGGRLPITVELTDAFGGPDTYAVRTTKRLCNPAAIGGDAPPTADHVVAYALKARGARPALPETVGIVDQFGARTVRLARPGSLWAPGAMSVTGYPFPIVPSLDHYECHNLKSPRTRIADLLVRDAFGALDVTLLRPRQLCAPVDMDAESPGAETHDVYYVCYESRPANRSFAAPAEVFVETELGPARLARHRQTEVCVPALRTH